MTPSSWAARAAIGFAALGATASGCGGAAATPSTPASYDESLAPAGGIGLGNFDAGSDAHVAQADAGTPPHGRLAPALIQKVVRANFDAMRSCYNAGLRRNAALQGRVVAKFEVDTEGRVASVTDSGSDLPDREAVACILAEYRNLRFPKPEGGNVTVVYPIIFNLGD